MPELTANAPVIRPATASDGAALARIYNHYITSTIITFEEEPVTADQMAERVADVLAVPLPWLVAEQDGVVIGYAYATKWKPRFGYRFSTELTVYLEHGRSGHGTGARLYRELLSRLTALGIREAIGGIALPNSASIALHEKLGFEKVAHFRNVGIKFGGWIDVAYWQKSLEGDGAAQV